MATITIQFKDGKNRVDVSIKERAQLKKLAAKDNPKLTPAQRIGIETFFAVSAARQIAAALPDAIDSK